MNKYYEDDFENALECARRMKYSEKVKNVLIYAPWWIRLDMYDDFEMTPDMKEKVFVKKYIRQVYSQFRNFPFTR